MQPVRARVLLPAACEFGVRVGLVQIIIAALAGAACIPPPDGIDPAADVNSPPWFDLASVQPVLPIPTVLVPFDPNGVAQPCTFGISARIVDADTCYVDIRVVRENRQPAAELLFESPSYVLGKPTGTTCAPPFDRPFRHTLNAVQFSGLEENTHQTLSIFVKDTATPWSDNIQDYGLLADVVPAGGTVIELRWAILFTSGECGLQ